MLPLFQLACALVPIPGRLGLAAVPITARAPALRACDTGDDQNDLFASLRSRVEAIGTECEQRWRKGECRSTINLALETWVRRIDVEWPRVAVGTADGLVMLADLEQGTELVRCNAHPRYIETPESAGALA